MPSDVPPPSRDELALKYLEQLPYTPYPVQEEALLAWFDTNTGVLVSAPTGTGKTLIAEAAVFEALHTGKTVYYTTPLIALSEQKFREIQAAAVGWGFAAEEVGLVTGNRRVNPGARVLVVVAEILLNRLLHPTEFPFDNVTAVVMDEFHNFSDLERGIVWEFSLSLLPDHVRLMLLSATIGNANPFVSWLHQCHGRRLELVVGTERKVPLNYRWIPDKTLIEHLEEMADGDAETRRTPALVFCFNRDECWSIAEELKGRSMLADGQQKLLVAQLAEYDLTKGAGPKLKQILMRGVGVHHAGLLPRYKRIVEDLFQKKLLSVCVCTETLAAGINLPARSVVLPSLMKGKPGQQKLIDPSSAHQIFGRAGRPQFDKEGFVFVLPHEDDVKILRWKEKYDQIPEDTKDPMLIRAKKSLKKKQPTRNPEKQYWNEQQFDKLRAAPAGDLVSRGHLPWRLLAYLLQLSPDVDRLRSLIRKRLVDPKQLEANERHLERMLLALHTGGFVRLEPEPPAPPEPGAQVAQTEPETAQPSWLSQQLQAAIDSQHAAKTGKKVETADQRTAVPQYHPKMAHATETLELLFGFRSINPLYGLFLVQLMGVASPEERLQLWESTLELPGNLLRYVRVPPPRIMPPGPLATTRVDLEIVQRGLMPAGDLYPDFDPDVPFEERKYPPALAEKVRMLFEHEYSEVRDVRIQAVWAIGDLLNFSGDFTKFISGRDLAKQEGLIFRHVLRTVLLLGEFSQFTPPEVDPEVWRAELRDLANQLTESCRAVDPQSTEHALQHAADHDLLRGEAAASAEPPPAVTDEEISEEIEEFGGGIDA
ncbi:DEAD/DEAH box helicase [Planctellipticum variicoloris]|uniref:DEAD/DEAH box helicase n=1 Tax=Planctellipticum variicoloris TaxID=3064265 RepID=UPI003013238C|nr:DEAD/DEAH box helicase [Planctomycetaceae bacterium SH412]